MNKEQLKKLKDNAIGYGIFIMLLSIVHILLIWLTIQIFEGSENVSAPGMFSGFNFVKEYISGILILYFSLVFLSVYKQGKVLKLLKIPSF